MENKVSFAAKAFATASVAFTAYTLVQVSSAVLDLVVG